MKFRHLLGGRELHCFPGLADASCQALEVLTQLVSNGGHSASVFLFTHYCGAIEGDFFVVCFALLHTLFTLEQITYLLHCLLCVLYERHSFLVVLQEVLPLDLGIFAVRLRHEQLFDLVLGVVEPLEPFRILFLELLELREVKVDLALLVIHHLAHRLTWVLTQVHAASLDFTKRPVFHGLFKLIFVQSSAVLDKVLIELDTRRIIARIPIHSGAVHHLLLILRVLVLQLEAQLISGVALHLQRF